MPWFYCRVGMEYDLVPVLRRQRFDRLDHAVDQWRKNEGFEIKLHPPGLDLGEIEDVVDQREQMPAGAEHPVERLEVLLCCFGILPQHLADADDVIERRAQLMAHIGEELRLMLARLRELAALVLDFIEQANIFNCDNSLVCECSRKLDLFIGEGAHRPALEIDDTNGCSLTQKWHT